MQDSSATGTVSSPCHAVSPAEHPVARSAASIPLAPGMRDKLMHRTLEHIRHKVFIMSGKGGVGKSSVTVNLAVAMADRGLRVGILDADMHGPSVPNLLGLRGRSEADGPHSIQPLRYDERLAVISTDALLAHRDDPIVWRGPQKTGAIRQFVSDVAWGELDVLLIDSPPGTGDEHMTILKAMPDVRCILVTTPQEISLADVRKAIGYLRRAHADILGVVENMSGLICPHCGGAIDLFSKDGGRKLASAMNLPFLGAIPLDPVTVVAADRGEPMVRLGVPSPAREALRALADTVLQALGYDTASGSYTDTL